MPDQTPRPSTPPHGGVATTHATTEEKEPASGLSLPQIMAGALAAATAAILGSFLGVIGTIGGAAAASVISTVGAALYQRSLERTRDAVKSRLVVNQAAGSKVATAVAKVAGGAPQAAPPARRRPPRTGRPQAPMSPPYGMPGRPGPMPPGAPTQRMPGGPQQLRAGGRTVTTRLDPAGRPVAEDHTRRIPDARTPDGRPTQVVPPLGPDGRPMANPTARMPMGPPSPPGGSPTAYLGGPGPGDDPTQLAPAARGAQAAPLRLEDLRDPRRRRREHLRDRHPGELRGRVGHRAPALRRHVRHVGRRDLRAGHRGAGDHRVVDHRGHRRLRGDHHDVVGHRRQQRTGEQGTQAPSSTTRAPSTTTPRNGDGNPLPSLLPRFNEQGGATGN